MAMQDEKSESTRAARAEQVAKSEKELYDKIENNWLMKGSGWDSMAGLGKKAVREARGSLGPDDMDVLAKQYGGGLRGQAGDRYRQLGGMAAAVDNRNIAMSDNEIRAQIEAGLARRQQLAAVNEYRAAALGQRPSLAQAQAGREQAYLAGGLAGMGANTKGPNMALGQGLAMGAGGYAMAERGGQAADQYATERQRSLAGWSQGSGQVRTADNAMYGMQIDRAMQQRGMNDQRYLSTLGMQEGVAEAERRARIYNANRELTKVRADSDRAAAESMAAHRRKVENEQMGVKLFVSGATMGMGGGAMG